MHYAHLIDQYGNLILEISKRKELTRYHQHTLASLYRTDTRLYCCCRDKNLPELHIANYCHKYVLRLNPTSYPHDESCPLYNDDGMSEDCHSGFTPSIFEEDIATWRRSGRSKHRYSTGGYNRFARVVFARAQGYALNACTSASNANWKTFDLKMFFHCLDSLLSRDRDLMKNGLTVYRSLPSNLMIGGGIIEREESASAMGIECEEWLTDRRKPRKIKPFDPKKVVEKAIKKKTIFGNHVEGPHLYLAVFDKSDLRLVKMFVYPIAIKNGRFAFCDSQTERNFARSILCNDSIIFKPISLEDDYYRLRKSFFPKVRPFLKYAVDFVVFHKPGEMQIVEVVGFQHDVKYMNHLRHKEKHYLELQSKHLGLRYVRK